MKLACFGYKLSDKVESDNYGPKSSALYNSFDEIMYDYEDITCICGMNPGLEMIFCWVAITNNYPLIAVIPYKAFDLGWSPEDQKLYKEALAYPQLELIVANEGGYKEWKDYSRNQYIVDHMDIGIFVGSDSRLKKVIDYTKHVGKEYLTIDEKKLIRKPQIIL